MKERHMEGTIASPTPSGGIYAATQEHLKQLYAERNQLEERARYVLGEIAKLEAAGSAMANLMESTMNIGNSTALAGANSLAKATRY